MKKIGAILTEKSKELAQQECKEMGWGKFKPLLAEAVINAISPIQVRYSELMNDRSELNNVLIEGKDKAESVANTTLKKIHKAMGFLEKDTLNFTS